MAGGSSSAPPKPGLVFWGKVSSVISATQFTCDILRGKGDNFFMGWAVHCVRKADGTGGWPQHDEVACAAYVSATGLFTHGVFVVDLSIGDEIYLVHYDISRLFRHGFINHSGYSPQNWNSGVATSGNAGGDLTTIFAPCLIHNFMVSMRLLTLGANVTIRMYKEILATENEFYNQTFVQGTDPDGIPIIDGTIGFYTNVRIEVYSDQAGDDARHIEYDYAEEVAH